MDIKSTDSRHNRGQAYTIESLLGVIVIIVAVLFVSSSFAIPVSNADIDKEINSTQEVKHLDSIIDEYQDRGAIRTALLHYNFDENHWKYGPINESELQQQNNLSERFEYPSINTWNASIELSTTNDTELTNFVDDLEEFEDTHNVELSIEVQATNATGETKRIPMVVQPSNTEDFMETREITSRSVHLSGTDIVSRDKPGVLTIGSDFSNQYRQTSNTVPGTIGVEQNDVVTLYDTQEGESNSTKDYFIGPHDKKIEQQELYNTVEMIFIIKK